MRLPARGDCWFSKFSQLAAINKGLQDVLLHVEIVVVDGRHGLAEGGKVFHRFVDAVIVDVVACRFCAQDQVIADILLDKAVSIMAADQYIDSLTLIVYSRCARIQFFAMRCKLTVDSAAWIKSHGGMAATD